MNHSKEVHEALNYIEANLGEDLSLEKTAKQAGFSKYYFHRLFQQEIGMPLYEYIKKRRLANAASLLLNTDVSIIDIALMFHFESQEAFSRAFKKTYQLPPGRYRATVKGLVKGEMFMNQEINKGWFLTGTAPEKYRMGKDRKIFHMGTKSATLQSIEAAFTEGDFGSIMQQFSAANYLGKRMRFSAFVKSAEVAGWAGLWMRMDNRFSAMLRFDNMQDRAIQGTTDWNHYACVLDVPEDTAIINIGILLCGKGKLWVDNASFEEVAASVPTTDFNPDEIYPAAPHNLSFED